MVIIIGILFAFATVGAIFLTVIGLAFQLIGFLVLIASEKLVPIKYGEFERLVDGKVIGPPYLQSAPDNWRRFMGWVFVTSVSFGK